MKLASRADNSTQNRLAFYATPELTQRINLIHHLLQYSEQLLLILADEGKGKTTMLNQVVTSASEHWKIFTVTSTPTLSEQTLINALLGNFNVRGEGKTPAALRDVLRTHIAATRYNGQLPILVIDDAHMLPLDTLSFLVRLVMTGEPQTRIRMLLFCEPQITSIFAAPEFEIMRNTLIHTLDIPGFAEKQVRGYLQFHLNQARYSATNPFTDAVVHDIYQDSEGIPARINEQIKVFLAKKQSDRPPTPSIKLPRISTPRFKLRHAILLGGVVLFFILMIAITSWIKQVLFSSEPVSEPKVASLPIATLPTPPQDSPLSPDVPPLLAAPPPPENVPPPPENVPSQQEQLAVTSPPVAPEEQDALPSEDDFSDLPGIYSTKWFKKQNPEAYTIQILSTYDKEAIPGFVSRHNLRGDLAIISMNYRGKPYYKLFYGLFNDRDAANAELLNLPSSLRRTTKPWLRSIRAIQSGLK